MHLSISILVLLSACCVLAHDLRAGPALEDARREGWRLLLFGAAVVAGSGLVLEAGPTSAFLVFLLIPVISVCLWRLHQLVRQRWPAPYASLVLSVTLLAGVTGWLALSPGHVRPVPLIQRMLDPGAAVPAPESIDPDAHRLVRS